MPEKYIIALDQGTTSSRAVLFNLAGEIVSLEQEEFEQHFPKPGWVEHDAKEIWQTQSSVLTRLVSNNKLNSKNVVSIGITNQRETTVVWDKRTGEPVSRAIVWQDRRTAEHCERLKKQGLTQKIRAKTGLLLDAYFSATKIRWILDNIDGAQEKADKGHLLFGTIDSWLIWKLTAGKVHATDLSNASRTLLLDINSGRWDDELLAIFEIPCSMLPELKDSADDFGYCQLDVLQAPISGVAGDQQAALFGQACFEIGQAKNTYGTGCFMLMNTGEKRVNSESGLLSTIAWRLNGKIVYALEGSVFVAGAAVQWLRDQLQIIESAADTELLATGAHDESGVVVVPAFAGLGAPHWDMYARGAIFGLTRDSGRSEIARATLESLAYQSYDVLQAMQRDSKIEMPSLNVDGGAIANNYLAQFQANILQKMVRRPKVIESTALGAAYLAGVGCGALDISTIVTEREVEREFQPKMLEADIHRRLAQWNKAVQRSKDWLEPRL